MPRAPQRSAGHQQTSAGCVPCLKEPASFSPRTSAVQTQAPCVRPLPRTTTLPGCNASATCTCKRPSACPHRRLFLLAAEQLHHLLCLPILHCRCCRYCFCWLLLPARCNCCCGAWSALPWRGGQRAALQLQCAQLLLDLHNENGKVSRHSTVGIRPRAECGCRTGVDAGMLEHMLGGSNLLERPGNPSSKTTEECKVGQRGQARQRGAPPTCCASTSARRACCGCCRSSAVCACCTHCTCC